MGTAISKGNEGRNTFHQLPNELVFEMCRAIAAIPTSEQILLSAQIIWAYLAPRFRKKLIYRDVVAFLKAGLKDRTKKVNIRISQVQVADGNENEQHVLIEQRQSEDEFVLSTNQMGIRIETGKLSTWRYKIKCEIADEELKNAHPFYFVRLIAPLIRPTKLCAWKFPGIPIAQLRRVMSALPNCVDWPHLDAEQFLAEPICSALCAHNKLRIDLLQTSLNDLPQFCGAFIRWLTAPNKNSGGQPKKCLFCVTDLNNLSPLLDEIKTAFSGATNANPFTLRAWEPVAANLTDGPSLAEFTLYNDHTLEYLTLVHEFYTNGQHYCYLIRRPIGDLSKNNSKYKEFDIGKKAEILLARTMYG